MAVSDIPPFVPASPDDLIRSEDINNAQRLARAAARAHRHTRVLGPPANDASAEDLALQVGTTEIVDLAVTANKLAGNAVAAGKVADGAIASVGRLTDLSVSTTKLQDAAVTASKLAVNAVSRANVQDGAVGRTELELVEVASGGQALGPFGGAGPASQVVLLLRTGLLDAQTTLFWPQLTVSSASGTGAFAQVEAAINYRRIGIVSSGPAVVDLMLRLTNTGPLSCTVNWRVMTFAPFNPAYPFGIRAGIGGDLV